MVGHESSAALIEHARHIVRHFDHVRYDVKEVILELVKLCESHNDNRLAK